MKIELTESQLQLVNAKQSIINQLRSELAHAVEKLDLYVTGVATAKGVDHDFRYEIKESAIHIQDKPAQVTE